MIHFVAYIAHGKRSLKPCQASSIGSLDLGKHALTDEGLQNISMMHYGSRVTDPEVPSTRTRWPDVMRRWTSGTPATAGRPNSRATMAPWDRTPSVSITRPRACTNSGTQAGSVDGQTRM